MHQQGGDWDAELEDLGLGNGSDMEQGSEDEGEDGDGDEGRSSDAEGHELDSDYAVSDEEDVQEVPGRRRVVRGGVVGPGPGSLRAAELKATGSRLAGRQRGGSSVAAGSGRRAVVLEDSEDDLPGSRQRQQRSKPKAAATAATGRAAGCRDHGAARRASYGVGDDEDDFEVQVTHVGHKAHPEAKRQRVCLLALYNSQHKSSCS